MSAHEDLTRDSGPPMGGDRPFGLVFAAVFLLLGLWPLHSAEVPEWWEVLTGVVILGIALVKPSVLQPLNWIWFQFGLLLHRLTNPLLLGGIFFLVVTPSAFLMRLVGKDPLRLRLDPRLDSYWIKREVPPGSLRHLF